MIKEQLLHTLKEALDKLNLSIESVDLAPPKDDAFGDYSSPVALALAKKLKGNPFDLAEQIAKEIPLNEYIEKVDVIKPGFINIWINKTYLKKYLSEMFSETYGSSKQNNKKIIVEYSSPNIAKPFTIGHLRSTIIGDAIANLLQATGYTVYRDNHVGDWGTQFGKLIYAIKTWASIDEIEKSKRPVKVLVELYIKFHSEAEINPELEDEGRKWFKKLEEGNEEAKKLWKQCIEWSWKEFNIIYEKLGVSFTENDGRGFGESYFEDKMTMIITELKETLGPRNLYAESKGAELVFFPEEKYPPLMIIKQDGSTLYSTRDLATDKFRLSKYGNDVTIINEVGAEQSLYFQQLFETEKLLGWIEDGQRRHIKHGMYRFKDMKMSTRKGNVIWLEEVLEEATKRASELSKNNTEQLNDVSETVGIGALKWNDLKRTPHIDIIFDWDEILNMDGNSGPYMQYTYARCKSVLNKTNFDHKRGIKSNLNEDELQLLRQLSKFPEIVNDAALTYSPSYVCTYLFGIAQLYNVFYQKNPILKADDEDKHVRLALTAATAKVIQNGLKLLGIKTVEKM